MQFWQRDENWATPIDAPAYPPPPAHCRDVMFQTVYFTTDPKNIAPLLLEPLEPSPRGRCCAFGIDAQFCAEYGPFKGAPPEDVTVDRSFKGPGVVSFTPTVAGDFLRLHPRSFEGAVYQVVSYTAPGQL